MRFLAWFRSVAAKFFHRSQIERDMEEELRSHTQHRADDLERSGLDRAEAERRARIEFGGHGRFKEECREALGGNFIEILMRDVRFSVPVLRKSPGFTIVAVLTLALAIAANAVVFGILNALILRPLNVPQAESLYGIDRASAWGSYQSYPDYLDLRDHNRGFDGLAAYTIAAAGLDADQYCVILPPMSRERFTAAVGLADVILDTPGWSGGKSTLDCLAADPAIVTLPGRFMRGRHTAAILRRIGGVATIARSLNEYVEIAARLGRDADWRATQRLAVAAGKPRAFRDMEYMRALETFLAEAVARS